MQSLPCRAGEIVFPCLTFVGKPEDYDFGSQRAAYGKLNEILALYNLKFEYMGASNVKQNPSDYNRNRNNLETDSRPAFVVVAVSIAEPVLVWERFIGTKNRGSLNSIYVSGQKFTLHDFISMCDLKRAMLFV